MTQTVYTVRRSDGREFQTFNAEVAQHESMQGNRVTAYTNQWV